jgi:6-pyruvoyltetrahydropterin/6-carboxytetrahydropterin synthase
LYSVHVKDQRMHFSASHFVRSNGDTENLHGHNYMLGVHITGPLNDDGMVIDFRSVKKRSIELCQTLDHKVILPGASETISVNTSDGFTEVKVAEKQYVFPEEDCVIIPTKATTAELLAKHIHDRLGLSGDFNIRVCVEESTGAKGCYEA